ncbi:MAG: MMPL family transporter [Xanthomonadales bacterium]|nr:MMPL family transporter [Xanthomonadales bacterium]
MRFNNLWLRILWVTLLVGSIFYISNYLKIESSILKLLPKYEEATTNAFIQIATETVNKQVVLLASSSNKQLLVSEFKKELQQLQQLDLIKETNYEVATEKLVEVYQLLSPFRQNLLSLEDRQALVGGMGADYFIHQAQQALYGLQQVNFEQLISDPLFLFQRYLMGFNQLNVMSFDSGEMVFLVDHEDQHHMAAFIELKDSAFSPDNQAQFVAILDQLEHRLADDNIELSAFGAALYAHQAYQDAKHEISTVGLGSLLGIVLLLLLVFRSTMPLIFSLFAIGLGLLVALALTLFVYGYVHAFALVFGATIAGVSIDYCFHYLTEAALSKNKDTSSRMVLQKILPALLIGFTSSATVYLAFMITGYEVLGQISVFSVCGLAAVLINVMLIFPAFYRVKFINQQSGYLAIAAQWLNNPLQAIFRNIWVVLLVLFFLMVVSMVMVVPEDDVRALQKLSPELKQQEQRIKQVLSWRQGNAYLLLTADSLEEVIDKEQELLRLLRARQNNEEKIEGLVGVSDFLPGVKQQLQNFNHIQSLMQSPAVLLFLTDLGIGPIPVETFKPMTQHLLEQPAMQQLFKQRLLGQVGNEYGLLLPLGLSVEDVQLPEMNGLVLVQQAEDTSALFAQFRIKSSWVLAITVAILVLLLGVFRYNTRQAIHLVSLPLMAGFVALVLAAALGYHISMFSILAMLLVLGMGLDYVVFLRESKQPNHVMFALMLSATTTILAFGLLSFSDVAVLKSFGFMVGMGILTVLCLSPAVLVWVKDLK